MGWVVLFLCRGVPPPSLGEGALLFLFMHLVSTLLAFCLIKKLLQRLRGVVVGSRDDKISCQGIQWIVVQDEIDPETNGLRKWQYNAGSCCISYASKIEVTGTRDGHPCI